jgi:phytoene dehydrogenase-like protein
MPLDRADAVVIGAGVEGLSAALTLLQSGKQVVCVDRRSSLGEIGGWNEAWVSPASFQAAGLFQFGLRLGVASPQLSLEDGAWFAIWPDPERSARAIGAADADAFLEFATALQRWRLALREPGMAARAMLASLDLVRVQGDAAELGLIMRSSASEILDRWPLGARLKGLILAMSAVRSPVSPREAASAPMLLAVAPYFDRGAFAARPVAGGAPALVATLAAAFQAAGGQLWLGREVSEIVMEREAAAGVAFGAGVVLKAATVIAAVAPKRLAQGLLSTRRYGRILQGLRAPPRKTAAALRLGFVRAPDLPEAHLGLWRQGVSVWLGAREETIVSAAAAFRSRRVHGSPVLELRFDPNLRNAICVSPYCPPELDDGPWPDVRRTELRDTILAAIQTQWPQAYASIESAQLLWPRENEASSATGAIFGGAERMPDLHELFGLNGETPGALLKGVYLCTARALDTDGFSGASTATAAAGLSLARARA